MSKEKTTAEVLHDGKLAKNYIENYICELFEKYHPFYYDNDFDFDIGSDDYDNSLEVYFNISIPYPFEPCYEVRKALLDLGFNIIFWNFREDKNGDFCDEIRGFEPRRYSAPAKHIPNKYGYVDERFNEEEYLKHNYRGENK